MDFLFWHGVRDSEPRRTTLRSVSASSCSPLPSVTTERDRQLYLQLERRSHPKHRIKTKSPWTSHGLFVLARCKGFEPPTYWFVARHSIQLS